MASALKLAIVLYILVIFAICCTKAISASTEESNEEQRLDKVLKLPGQTFNVSFKQYSGYITVNQENGKALFYWFFEATRAPSHKPLILWLNGGPGCSSIGFGEAEEVGPFHIKKDGKTLQPNPYSWNKASNIIFVDSPVGTGYSYSNTSSDIENNGDQSSAEDNLQFILNWLKRFPQYKGREFYVTGESYAGHFVPQLSKEILEYNAKNEDNSINLKGFMIGNPLVDDHYDQKGIFQFMWTLGLISDESYKALNLYCTNDTYLSPSKECNNAHGQAATEIGDIDYYSVFTPTCSASKLARPNWFVQRWMKKSQLRLSYDPCTEKYSILYFNQPEVQQALHVKGAPLKWDSCSNTVHYKWKDSAESVLPTIKDLTQSGIRVWIYSGDTDAVIPVTATRYSINALNLTKTGPWRAWNDDGQVGGWTQEYEGLTFVTVRSGGHEVPLHKPKQALTLFKSFISGQKMPSFTKLSSDS